MVVFAEIVVGLAVEIVDASGCGNCGCVAANCGGSGVEVAVVNC